MKIGHLLLVTCVLGYAASCFAAATVESEALFQEANKQYRAGKFEEAAALYDKIEDKGSVVYYNLGNCYYQQGQAGKALLNWRRAEQFGHVWERRELLDNIMFLHKQLGKSVLVGRVARFIYRMRLFLTRGPLLVFQVVFLLLWVLLLLGFKFMSGRMRRAAIALFSCGLVFCGGVLAFHGGVHPVGDAVIIAREAPLRSGPAETFQVLGSLPEAHEVIVQKVADDYCKIKVDEQVGWIRHADLAWVVEAAAA